ncbi:hypothetical protein [Silvanigrella sp.]|jgi:hypothetical protein|uniref:hypothetical protein n=1 Tax=Silvanigrella sp. TaxID=2024976 RepID=UPI0037CA9AF4
MKAYINKNTHYKCDYDLKYPWPDHTVLKPMYDTDENNNKINFCFDLYIKIPETVIFTEGDSFEECEDFAWNKYNEFLNCSQHKYELINKERLSPSSWVFACNKCGQMHLGDKALFIKSHLADTAF